MTDTTRNISYWVTSTLPTNDPPLDSDIDVEVAVVGGGLVGITTAFLLQQAGKRVAIIEMDRIVQGVTGYTTAKLTAGHNIIYGPLISKHGEETARAYAAANQDAIDWIRDVIAASAIDCDLETRSNFVYTEDPLRSEDLQREAKAAQVAGLPAIFTRDTDLPFPIAGAVQIADQAQFHPRKYLLNLAQRLRDGGAAIYENTRVVDVNEKAGRCELATTGGQVTADHAVIASHYPFTDRGLFFARVHPKRSYALSARLRGSGPDGMYISADEPTRSLRTVPDPEGPLLLVGGNGHAVGQVTDTRPAYDDLERWAFDRFEVSEVTHRWSAQDGATIDLLPYVGTAWRSTDKIFVATGFGKWGLTNGTAAAHLISNRILGRPDPLAKLFDPHRITASGAPRAVRENAKVGFHLLKNRISHPNSGAFEDLEPGQAAVKGVAFDQVAGYRDEDGKLHCVSAVCTHLGCVVAWNTAERTWDCPCHGSRFSFEGRVLEGPAVKDLEPRDDP